MSISELQQKVMQFVNDNYVPRQRRTVICCVRTSCTARKLDLTEKSDAYNNSDQGLVDFVNKRYEEIGKNIVKFIKARGENYRDVYKTAEISPQLWHKYMTGQSKPGRDNMFRMAVVMDLEMNEAKKFLRLAGFNFSRCSKKDLVMEYFFSNGVSDYKDINSCFKEIGLEPLFAR